MSNYRPIKKKCWINFLKYKNCIPSNGTNHVKWKCPNCLQSIIFRNGDKDIPFGHIKTNLSTMEITIEEFMNWVKENC